MLPLEILLSYMNNPAVSDHVGIECARAAAPYCHPRLNATEQGSTTKTHEDRLAEIPLDGRIGALEVSSGLGTSWLSQLNASLWLPKGRRGPIDHGLDGAGAKWPGNLAAAVLAHHHVSGCSQLR